MLGYYIYWSVVIYIYSESPFYSYWCFHLTRGYTLSFSVSPPLLHLAQTQWITVRTSLLHNIVFWLVCLMIHIFIQLHIFTDVKFSWQHIMLYFRFFLRLLVKVLYGITGILYISCYITGVHRTRIATQPWVYSPLLVPRCA